MAIFKKKAAFSRKKSFQKRKKQKNPKMFHPAFKKPVKRISFLESRLYIFFGIGILIALVYFIFFSPFFQIKKVVIDGHTFLLEEEINEHVEEQFRKKRFLVFSQNNIFFFSEKQAREIFMNQEPVAFNITYKKEFPDILKVSIQESEISAIWEQNGSDYYFLSQNGTICKQTTSVEVEMGDFPIIKNNQQKVVTVGDQVTASRIVAFVKKLEEQFESKTGFSPQYYLLPAANAPEVHLKTDRGFEVYFSLEQEIEGQLENLKLVLEKELTESLDEIEYIDLRVNNKVYYK